MEFLSVLKAVYGNKANNALNKKDAISIEYANSRPDGANELLALKEANFNERMEDFVDGSFLTMLLSTAYLLYTRW